MADGVAVVRVPADVLAETYYVRVNFGARAEADIDSDDAASDDASEVAQEVRRRAPRHAGADYDLDDPFIDDTEEAAAEDNSSATGGGGANASRSKKGKRPGGRLPEIGEEAAAAAAALAAALPRDAPLVGVPAMAPVFYVWRGALGAEGAVRPVVPEAAERGVIRRGAKRPGRPKKAESDAPKRRRAAKSGGESQATCNTQATVSTQSACNTQATQSTQIGPQATQKSQGTATPDGAEEGKGTSGDNSGPTAAKDESQTQGRDEGGSRSAPRTPRKRAGDTALPFAELEAGRALAAFAAAAAATSFPDPKKFPSSLRPALDRVVATQLRLSHATLVLRASEKARRPEDGGAAGAPAEEEKKADGPEAETLETTLAGLSSTVASVPASVYDAIAAATPFSAGAVERVVCSRAFSSLRDDIRANLLPSLYGSLAEAMRSASPFVWDDSAKATLLRIYTAELDAALLDRVDALCEAFSLKAGTSGEPGAAVPPGAAKRRLRALLAPLSEAALRRAVYARVSALSLPPGAPQGAEPPVRSAAVGAELNAYRRRVEAESLAGGRSGA